VWRRKSNDRSRCAQCGTPLFAEIPGMGVRGVNGYLLPPERFVPAFHIQCQHAVRPVRDGLPHYKGFPGRFGGTDETVAWEV
jgi:hypothetical protein